MEKEEYIGPYKLVNKIGEGSFGQIFLGLKDSQYIAIKTEHISIVKPMLMLQYSIFKELHQHIENQAKINSLFYKGFSFPKVYLYQEEEHFSFMSMEKLDTTLQDLANIQLQNKLSKDVLLLVMYNTLKCLETLHEIGYVYRDVKPSNFMVKQSDLDKEKGTIYLIDLGLCKKYLKNDTDEHIRMKENKKMIGTPVFCSLNTHKGMQNGRRDDLESWIYMIIYLVKKLPWEDFSLRRNSKLGQQTQEEKSRTYEAIGKVKGQTNIIQLIKQEDKLPLCLCKIYEHITQLTFEMRPNYQLIYKLIQQQYNRLVGTKTTLNDIFLRTKSTIDDKRKKNIKITFKLPEKKVKENGQTEEKKTEN